MNQRVEMKIGGATVVVTSETIKARIIRDNLFRKSGDISQTIADTLGVEDESIVVSLYNYCIFSARLTIEKGKLTFELLLPSDSIEEATKKTLAFLDVPYDDVYQNLYNLINRIDAPDNTELAPGATDEYKDLSEDEFDELPEAEKKS
ncbi:MAG: hypothetical protein ACYTBJ_14715 [Planctomycetota bacterium]|jgi:hypothetical protein